MSFLLFSLPQSIILGSIRFLLEFYFCLINIGLSNLLTKRYRGKIVNTVVCCACLQYFATRPRLVEHLHVKSKRCKHLYLNTFSKVHPDELAVLEEEDKKHARSQYKKGLRRLTIDSPVVRCDGPLLKVSQCYFIRHRTLLKEPVPKNLDFNDLSF